MNLPRKVKTGHSQVAQSPCEAKYEAIDTIMICILMQIKPIFTRKVLHLASFWNTESAYCKIALNSKTSKIAKAQILAGWIIEGG